MQPEFRAAGAQYQGSGSTGTHAIPYPTVQANDYIIMLISWGGAQALNATITDAVSQGWTAFPSNPFDNGSTAMRMEAYYKKATGSESGSVTFTTSQNVTGQGRMYSYYQVDPTTPFEFPSTVLPTADTHNYIECPAITPSNTANQVPRILRIGLAHTGTTGATVTAASGHTLRGQAETLPGTGTRTNALMDKVGALGTADPLAQFGLNVNAAAQVGVSLVMRGAPDGAPPPVGDPAVAGTPTTRSNASAAAITGNSPLGIVSGELLVLIARYNSQSRVVEFSNTAGWNRRLQVKTTAVAGGGTDVFTKVADASDVANAGASGYYVLTPTTSEATEVTVVRLQNVADYEDGAGTNYQSAASPLVCPSITTPGAKRLVLRFAGLGGNSTTAWASASELTDHGSAAAPVIAASLAYSLQALEGPTGTENAALTPSTFGQAVTLTFSPAVPTETLRPTGVAGLTNLTGAATDIDQDPDGAITDAGLVGATPASPQSGLTVGPVYPDARVGASGQTVFPWNTPANITDNSDTTLASVASATTTLADYFSFAAGAFAAIPAGSTITGISAVIKHRAGTAARVTPWLQLGTANGTLIGSEINPQNNSTTGAQLATTAGGITHTATAFGALPTLAQLQTSGAAGFGVRLRIVRSAAATYELYSIKVTVTYSTPGTTTNTQVDVALGDPVGTLALGAGTGQIKARIRKRGAGTNPLGRIELRNAAGSWTQAVIADSTITESDADGQLVSGFFDQSVITSKTDVIARFIGTGAPGGLAELVAVEWNAEISTVVRTPQESTRASSYAVRDAEVTTRASVYPVRSVATPTTRASVYPVRSVATPTTRASLYAVRSARSITRASVYAVRTAPAATTRASAYVVRSGASTTRASAYRVSTTATPATRSSSFALRSVQGTSRSSTYQILFSPVFTPQVSTRASAYGVRVAQAINRSGAYSVRAPATSTRASLYAVRGVATPTNRASVYAVRRPATPTTRASLYAVRRPATAATRASAYPVRVLAALLATRQSVYAVRRPATAAATRTSAYAVRAVATPSTRASAFLVRAIITSTRASAFRITATAAPSTRASAFLVRAIITSTRASAYAVRSTALATKTSSYALRVNVAPPTRTSAYAVRKALLSTRASVFEVKASTVSTRGSVYRVSVTATPATRTSGYPVRTLQSATRSSTFRITVTTTASTRASTYSVRVAILSSRATFYQVKASQTSIRASTYGVRFSASTTRSSVYALRGVAAPSTRSSAYEVLPLRIPQVATRASSYAVRLAAASSRASVFAVRAGTLASRSSSYIIRALALVSSRASSYGVRELESSERQSAYALRTLVLMTRTSSFRVLVVGPTTVHSSSYGVRAPVTSTRVSAYEIRNLSGAQQSLRSSSYAAREMESSERSGVWALRTLSLSSRSGLYALRTAALTQRGSTYASRAAQENARASAYQVRASRIAQVASSYALRVPEEVEQSSAYRILVPSTTQRASSYAVRIIVVSERSSAYVIAGGEVSERRSAYLVRAVRTGTRQSVYAVRTPQSTSIRTSFALRTPQSTSKTSVYAVRTLALPSSRISVFRVVVGASGSPTVRRSSYPVRRAMLATRSGVYEVFSLAGAQEALRTSSYALRHAEAALRQGNWRVRVLAAPVLRSSVYALRQTAATTRQSAFAVRRIMATNRGSVYAVRVARQGTRASFYVIRVLAPEASRSGAFRVLSRETTFRTSSYELRKLAFASRQASYGVRISRQAQRASAYALRTIQPPATRDSSYPVRTLAETSRSSTYALRTLTLSARRSSYRIMGQVSDDVPKGKGRFRTHRDGEAGGRPVSIRGPTGRPLSGGALGGGGRPVSPPQP